MEKIGNKTERINKFSCGYEGWNCYCWNIFNDLDRGKCLVFFTEMKILIAYTCNCIYNVWQFYALVHYSKYEISQKFLNFHEMQMILHEIVSSFWFLVNYFLNFTKFPVFHWGQIQILWNRILFLILLKSFSQSFPCLHSLGRRG